MADFPFHFSAPLAIAALLPALAGCEGAEMQINGEDGVPLSEIELAGPPPSEVVLASGDNVILTDGDRFAITVEGADTQSLRFVRDEEVIGVTREDGWSSEGAATIRITMPPPRELVVIGSGTIVAQSLASTAEISIGGAGDVAFTRVAAEQLGINIGGSGTVKGAGTTKRLEINIGGSGDVAMPALKADSAVVAIGGAGDVAFASDGEVEASIAGAGDVAVSGNAKCTVNAFGSGTLTCTPTGAGSAALPAPAAPAAPAAGSAE
jgi:hypothetical protein